MCKLFKINSFTEQWRINGEVVCLFIDSISCLLECWRWWLVQCSSDWTRFWSWPSCWSWSLSTQCWPRPSTHHCSSAMTHLHLIRGMQTLTFCHSEAIKEQIIKNEIIHHTLTFMDVMQVRKMTQTNYKSNKCLAFSKVAVCECFNRFLQVLWLTSPSHKFLSFAKLLMRRTCQTTSESKCVWCGLVVKSL